MGERPSDQGRDREVGYGKPPKASQFKPGESGNPGGRPKSVLPRIMRDLMERCDREALEAILADPKRKVVELIAAADLLDALNARDHKNKRTSASRARVWDRMVGVAGKEEPVEGEESKRTRMIVEHRFVKEESDAQEEEGQGEG